eukprot:3007817-Amphidinium_carterae.1
MLFSLATTSIQARRLVSCSMESCWRWKCSHFRPTSHAGDCLPLSKNSKTCLHQSWSPLQQSNVDAGVVCVWLQDRPRQCLLASYAKTSRDGSGGRGIEGMPHDAVDEPPISESLPALASLALGGVGQRV